MGVGAFFEIARFRILPKHGDRIALLLTPAGATAAATASGNATAGTAVGGADSAAVAVAATFVSVTAVMTAGSYAASAAAAALADMKTDTQTDHTPGMSVPVPHQEDPTSTPHGPFQRRSTSKREKTSTTTPRRKANLSNFSKSHENGMR